MLQTTKNYFHNYATSQNFSECLHHFGNQDLLLSISGKIEIALFNQDYKYIYLTGRTVHYRNRAVEYTKKPYYSHTD